MRHALESKEEREGKWCRKFSSATYVKGLIDEVIPQVATDLTDRDRDDLDLSQGDSSQFSPLPEGVAEEIAAAEAAASAAGASKALTQKALKGKFQAGVQEQVNDFWKEKIGHYIMQGDYLALIMEEGVALLGGVSSGTFLRGY